MTTERKVPFRYVRLTDVVPGEGTPETSVSQARPRASSTRCFQTIANPRTAISVSIKPRRFALFANERHVMFDVPGGTFEKLLDREWTGFAVDAAALPVSGRKGTQNPCDVAAAGLDQPQLFFHIALVIGQPRRILLLVTTRDRRLVLGNGRRRTIDADHFEVGQMGDDFQRAPFARNGPSEDLLMAHPRHRIAKQPCAGRVTIQ